MWHCFAWGAVLVADHRTLMSAVGNSQYLALFPKRSSGTLLVFRAHQEECCLLTNHDASATDKPSDANPPELTELKNRKRAPNR